MTKNEFLAELRHFCDLDFEPVISASDGYYTARLRQDGEAVGLRLEKEGGEVIETRDGRRRKFSSYVGLLASQGFGNLKRLADAQKGQVRLEAPYIEKIESHLPIVGDLTGNEPTSVSQDLFEAVDSWLCDQADTEGEVRALVIDGPAGIGKTHLIRRLVYSRAAGYGPGSPPPILHIQSRGRRLTTLNDVLAGTLQSLRATLTYDQVPILVRHGLLQVAIDGFDELADPNGYDTAWGSLRDFIEELQGRGAVILAGRDTFINASSIRKAVARLDSSSTVAVHLRPLLPDEAIAWFRAIGWPENRIEALAELGLLSDGSYALRPFFLTQIKELAKLQKDFEKFVEFPLRALVSAMIEREAKLVRKYLQLPQETIVGLFQEILMEVARDMADSESEIISEDGLDLIAEMVLGKVVQDEQLSIFRHRMKSITLLEGDAQTSNRRFAHTEILDYFLGTAYVSLVAKGEISKSLRRGIIGGDFLATFHDIARVTPQATIRNFYVRAERALIVRSGEDRCSRNVAALILAALPSGYDAEDIPLVGVHNQTLDDAILSGEIPIFHIRSTDISQLDVRGADLTALKVTDSNIQTLVADGTTRFPAEWPRPTNLLIHGRERSHLSVPEEILSWLKEHTVRQLPQAARPSEHLVLLERLCRATLRQNWIRLTGDDPAAKLLSRPQWPGVRRILEEHSFLKIRAKVAVGGPNSDFYRIERARDFLEKNSSDPVIQKIKDQVAALD